MMGLHRGTLRQSCAIALAGVMMIAGAATAQDAVDPAAALEELQTTVLSTGPNGESPVGPTEVVLTDEELAQVAEMGATAAIVFHYGGNDWSKAQMAGLKATFEELGIEVIAITDADFDAGAAGLRTSRPSLVLETRTSSCPSRSTRWPPRAAYQEAADRASARLHGQRARGLRGR